jgi:hypothetical protein
MKGAGWVAVGLSVILPMVREGGVRVRDAR